MNNCGVCLKVSVCLLGIYPEMWAQNIPSACVRVYVCVRAASLLFRHCPAYLVEVVNQIQLTDRREELVQQLHKQMD